MHQSRLSDLYPQIWLMTDARNDAGLEKSIKALPRGSGIVFRHYHLPPDQRRERFEAVKDGARRGGHILLLADTPLAARRWGADGVYGWRGEGRRYRHHGATMLHAAPVHNLREIAMATHYGSYLFFLSPAFATRSHPGQRPLNRVQLRRLVALCRKPVILLGGMDAERYRQLADLGAYGWAAIDGLSV